jgi:hypothetical protein
MRLLSTKNYREDWWWECPECGEFFKTEEEADLCYMTDTWPEDARDWMHRGLIELTPLMLGRIN